jgi:hypothetical protein
MVITKNPKLFVCYHAVTALTERLSQNAETRTSVSVATEQPQITAAF